MAFNPFHTFRKHQKVLFAVLTIMCMFVFVLQFGRGDMFERLAAFFGGSRGRGEVVATLYRKKVTTGELNGPNGLRAQREMASNFVEAARQSLIEAVLSDPRAKSDKIDSRLRMAVQFLGLSPEMIRQLPQNTVFQQMFGAQRDLQSYQDELKNKEDKEEERQFADQVAEGLKIQQSMLFMRMPGTYFGATNTTEGLLDFKLWEHQADKLGIVLTESAVRALVKKETGGRDMLPERTFKPNDKSRMALANFSKRYANVPESQLVDALAAEYRVILAQEALLGQAEGYRGAISRGDYSPVTITPGQFLQYFREQRTTVKVALLPIPTEQFEKNIPDPTNDGELRELYAQYKNKVPAPAQAYPGFMEPRLVRVQYLIARAKDDFYQNSAKKFVPSTALIDTKLAIARQVLAGGGVASTGGGPGMALAVAGPLGTDPVLQQYNKYCEDQKSGLDKGYNVAPDIYDPSYDAASALGYILGGLAQGNPAAAPAAIRGTKQAHALIQARAGGAAIRAGTSPTPVSVVGLHALTDHVQPLDKVDSLVVAKARTKLANELLANKIGDFFQELRKLRSTPKEAEAFILKTAKADDFHIETMKSSKNDQQLSDDPALKDLRGEFAKRTPAPITKPVEFASEITRLSALYQWDLVRAPTGAKDPTTSQDEWCLYWLVEDNPAKIRSFAAAKPDVIKAWKRLQAHKMAIKVARSIEAKAQAEDWPTDFTARKDAVEAFLKRQKYGQPFVLENVARQVEKDSSNPGLSKLYEAYKPPEDKIQYPPEKFTDQLLSLKKAGDATWLQNRPETTLFVAVLLERTVPKYDDFLHAYQNSLSDSLWSSYVSQERQNFKTKFVENMRTEAAPKDTDNGKWKLPENLQKHGSANDDE